MTSTQTRQCQGAPTCRRPARWDITQQHGGLYLSQHLYGTAAYCKAHAELEIARLRAEMPDAERKRRYEIVNLRADALGTLSQAVGKLEELEWRLAKADAGFAAMVCVALGNCYEEGGCDAKALRQLCDALSQQVAENIPPVGEVEGGG